jgi:mannosylfructose-phosphate synthase
MNPNQLTIGSTGKSIKRKARERIAMISTHGYVAAAPLLGAPDTGGQVVYVIELSKKLAEFNYHVDIYTRKFEDQSEVEHIGPNVTLFRIPCGGSDFIPKEYLYETMSEWTQNAYRFIKKKKLRYSFINSHYWDAGIAAQRLSELLGVHHVHTPHSLGIWKKKEMAVEFAEDKASFEKKYNFTNRIKREMLLYREADLIIATTPPQVEILEREYDFPKSRIKMIPPGYDDSKFYPIGEATRKSIRESYGFKGKKVIGTIGRLALNKGYDLLIDAFSVVAQRDDKVLLLLAVGNEAVKDPNNELLKNMHRQIETYGLKKKVNIFGFVEDENLPDFYRALDVFALPSRYEPFGMVAVEAMACGTPTVITTNGGLFSTLSYGVHVLAGDPFDKEDFGITLLKAIRYPFVSDVLSVKGAHRARSLFTWTSIAQQLLNAVDEIP